MISNNNKNQYRRYPLKQATRTVSAEGFVVPDTLFVNCSLTSVYGKHRAYIKQIFYKAGLMRVTIASFFDDVALGVFEGNISQDFTALTLIPFVRNVSGSLTVGSSKDLPTGPKIFNFSKEAAELEESVIFCYRPPAVSSLVDKLGNALRGKVEFGILLNLTKTRTSKASNLEVVTPDSVANPNDKSTHLNNCSTPMIKNINGVQPFPAGAGDPLNDNNIYVAGVKPVIFYGIPDNNNLPTPGVVGLDTGSVTLDKLCTQKHKLIPPTDVSGFTLTSPEFKNMYYSKPALVAAPNGSDNYPLPRPERLASNFNSTTKPEYYYWPQFVTAEYYSYWNTPKH